MISFLRGRIQEKTAFSVVIDVAGVGYECGVSTATAASLPAPGENAECMLFTRMQVRDDALSLFGFATTDERAVFDKLVGVSGVGPKLALSVLSTFAPDALREVVATGDEKRMSSVPGVGKKTASRMILELKDSLGAQAPVRLSTSQLAMPAPPAASALDEACAALLSMGFTSAECELALKGYDGPAADTSAAIRFALKRLGS